MEQKKVISLKHIEAKPPIISTALVYLYLDVYNASGVWWGVCGTIAVLVWLTFIYAWAREVKHSPKFDNPEE